MKQRILIVSDMFSSHLMDKRKKLLKENNNDITEICSGPTIVLQPLEINFNKPFTINILNKWFLDGEKKVYVL